MDANYLLELYNNDGEFKSNVDFSIQDIPANNYILREKEANRDLFLILSGDIHVTTTVQIKGRETKLKINQLSKGDVFGESIFIDGESTSANIKSLTDCRLVRINGASIKKYVDSNPDKGIHLYRMILMQTKRRVNQSNESLKQLYENSIG